MTWWANREELEAAVVAYQANWWRENQDALTVIDNRTDHPGLRAQIRAIASLGQMVTTSDVYRPNHPGAPESRPYLPQRVASHERVAASCVPAASELVRTDREHPSAYFTIGAPGSGKTSVLRSVVDRQRTQAAGGPAPDPYSIIDADRVRQLLPEYADGLGAAVVQQECFDVTYGPVLDQALERRADIVFDTMGRLISIKESLELLHDQGFDIHVLHASSSFDQCCQRTEQRALHVDGRLVDPRLIGDAIEFADETMAALLNERFPLAGWARIDTTDMDVPTLIEGTSPWSELL